MTERFPGYDVLDKRQTLSWNEPTRRALDKRLGAPPGPRFLTEAEWRALTASCDRILPQPKTRPPVPIAAYIDEKLSDLFFAKRVLHDVVDASYAHPTAWNEMGWSGPASPRGYVRLDANRRDPWEAAEAKPGEEDRAWAESKHVV